ncbi:MAGE family-domain-containing protein [Paraphysoderma sedebokerense]|nr:MAGE family-domain-containing protein [Paraphysoderma sedebokerense]
MSRKRTNRNDPESEDEEYGYSQATQAIRRTQSQSQSQSQRPFSPAQSQSSQSQAEPSQRQTLPHDVLQRKATDLVRLALFQENAHTCLKRDDISKKVLKEYNRSFTPVFNAAQEKLKDIFGMEMVELPSKERVLLPGKAKQTNSGPTKSYVLRNVLKPEVVAASEMINFKEDNAYMGLLGIILSLIYVKEKVASDEFLLPKLRRLGIERGENHPVFKMDYDKLMAHFEKQYYIQRNKLPVDPSAAQDNTNIYEYRWGSRAKVEFEGETIVNFIQHIYQTPDDNQLREIIIKSAGDTQVGH